MIKLKSLWHISDNEIMKVRQIGIIFLTVSSFLLADDYVGKEVYSQVVFEDAGKNPIIVTDNRGWVDIGQVDLSGFFRIAASSSESVRKWKVRVFYLDENRTGQTTLQIRFRGEGFTTLFTLPWESINSVPQVKESNWFLAERMAPQSYQTLCSARMISPPGATKGGKIFKIQLEAWEFNKPEDKEVLSFEETLLASTRLIKPMGQRSRSEIEEDVSRLDRSVSVEEALDFSLHVVETSLQGNLPEFYRLLSDEIHSLSDGYSHSKFVVNPPEGVGRQWSLEDYKTHYQYRIYEYDDFIDLFPEWISPEREWVPHSNCFLFMGNQSQDGKFPFFPQDDILVFMVEYNEKREWKVIGRPVL